MTSLEEKNELKAECDGNLDNGVSSKRKILAIHSVNIWLIFGKFEKNIRTAKYATIQTLLTWQY